MIVKEIKIQIPIAMTKEWAVESLKKATPQQQLESQFLTVFPVY